MLRLAVGAPLTEKKHIDASWEIFQEKATILLKPFQNGTHICSNGIVITHYCWQHLINVQILPYVSCSYTS